MHRWLTNLVLASAGIFSPSLAAGQGFSESILDPFDVRSSSGQVVLHVDPSSPLGNGSATYTLSRDGQKLWTKELDWTLEKIAVGDDASFAGVQNKTGLFKTYQALIALIGPDGNVRYENRFLHERGSIHGTALPEASGCMIFPEQNRVLFRVVRSAMEPRSNRTYEEWTIVEQSTGRVVETIVPQANLTSSPAFSRLHGAQAIRGRPLVAAYSVLLNYETEQLERGAHFAVFDLEGHVIWERREPLDYLVSEDGQKSMKLWDWAVTGGALLECDEPGRFDLALVQVGKRVRYEVAVNPSDPKKWLVRELDRQDYGAPPKDEVPATKAPYSALDVELLGFIQLKRDRTVSAVGNVPAARRLDFAEAAFIDHAGRILAADARDHGIDVFEAQGTWLTVCRLSPDELGEWPRMTYIAVAPDLSIHVGPVADRKQPYRAFTADGGASGPESFQGILLFDPRNGNRWTLRDDLIELHSPEGTKLRKLRRSPDDRWLRGATGALAADGRLLVHSRRRYHVYSAEGLPNSSMDAPFESRFAALAFANQRVFAVGEGHVWSTDLVTGITSKAKLEAGPLGRGAAAAWREDLGELWVLDYRSGRLARYRFTS